MKSFRSKSVVVFVNSKDHDSRRTLPKKVRGAFSSKEAGKTIPIVVVTQPNGEDVVQISPYKELKADARKAARGLSKIEIQLASKTGEASVEMQTWTNSEGVSITAAVIAQDSQTVRFRLEDGREVDYPLSQLSEESRERLKESP